MDTKERKRPTGQVKRPVRKSGGRVATAGKKTVSKSSAEKSKQIRRKKVAKAPSADVVYTQPSPFNKYRFLLYLATVIAVVLAIVFGMSIFFKVSTVTVIGNEKYSAWDIREASGIQDGENLLSISEPKISNSITSRLPYVNKVRVGIKLPDTVKLEIVEFDVVYSVEATDGGWWLMRSDGVLSEQINSADAEQHTKILGVQLAEPKVGQQATAFQSVPQEEETVPVTVLASEQLQTAISIAQFLEKYGVIGEVASINVSDMGDLELWYGDRYQVLLGDALDLDHKVHSMQIAVDQMGDYQSGVLDASFTTWPNQVGYTPGYKEK